MLEVYQFEGCPYCQKVREKLSELGISYVLHNPRLGKSDDHRVTNETTYAELVDGGGMDQVPYLVDTDREVTMYESDDIVEYLETHYE
jgi:glutathione S-transferase